MRDRDIARALEWVAERDVVAPVDLWPAIAGRVERRPVLRRPSLQYVTAGALALALVAGSLALARQFGGAQPTPPVTAPMDEPVVSYAVPEVYPDLASLAAASDLVVRGRTMGAGQFAVEQVLLSRLQQTPALLDLSRPELPPGLERPPEEPTLRPDEEYIVFVARRYLYAAGAPDAPEGPVEESFRTVGGAQGQWLVRDGKVVQAGAGPLAAHDGEPLEQFVGAVTGAPDLRAAAAELLAGYDWSAGEPCSVTGMAAPSKEQLAHDADVRAWLQASRRIGLDWEPFAGRPVLYTQWELDAGGIWGTVLLADGEPIGAWLSAGERGQILGIDQRGEALAALAANKVGH